MTYATEAHLPSANYRQFRATLTVRKRIHCNADENLRGALPPESFIHFFIYRWKNFGAIWARLG